jgi:hypothetical protein
MTTLSTDYAPLDDPPTGLLQEIRVHHRRLAQWRLIKFVFWSVSAVTVLKAVLWVAGQ